MLGLGSLKIYAMIAVAVGTMIAGFYWYYQDSQKRLMALMENQAKLETAVQLQEQTIQQQQEDMKKQAETLKVVNDQFAKAQKDKQILSDKLSKHEIGHLAEKKPVLIEKIINKATDNAGRCFEILSGSPLTDEERAATKKSEINGECPSIANPNYVAE